MQESVTEDNSNDSWPLSINLDVPIEQQVLRQQEDVRNWIAIWRSCEKRSAKHTAGSLAWIERNWRLLGTQSVPEKLTLHQPEDAAAWIGKTDDWLRALERCKTLFQRWPSLIEVLPKQYAFLAHSEETDFLRLIEMVKWLCDNPDSNLYPRQIPVNGIDSKWLESHKGIVSALIAAIRNDPSNDFFTVCGLKPLPQLIRLRILDPQLRSKCGGLGDMSIPWEEAAILAINPARIFIVENLQTGLAFHDLPDSVVIMGLGYGIDILRKIPWLAHTRCLYWGDIDTHGFAILNRVRKYLPAVESLLMDEETLLSHRDLWVEEKKQSTSAELPLLTGVEQKLYDSLKSNAWGQNVRLEQERICWDAAWKNIK